MSNYFRAKFEARCPACNKTTEEGDWAAYDEDGNVICRSCAEDDSE